MNEWNLQSRARHCQSCQRPFVDKTAYHTVLFEDKQQYHRLDICADCWAAQYAEGVRDRKGFISHWQGIYQAPPPAPPEPIRRETAESLLRKLIQANDVAHGPACYILAAMLERKRLLKVKEQLFHEGARVFLYEQPSTGDLFTITDPNLQLNQLEAVQRDIAQLLSEGLLPGPSASSAPVLGDTPGATVSETPRDAGSAEPEPLPEAPVPLSQS